MLKTALPGCEDGSYRQVFKALFLGEKAEKKKVCLHSGDAPLYVSYFIPDVLVGLFCTLLVLLKPCRLLTTLTRCLPQESVVSSQLHVMSLQQKFLALSQGLVMVETDALI